MLTWSGKFINSPEQRLIQGATALMTQPVIDYKNKNVDEETRKISVARTLAKITAGTTVGVLVRWLGIKAINAFSNIEYDLECTNLERRYIRPRSKRDIFVPKELLTKAKDLSTEEMLKQMTRYRKAMGTLIATVAMVITNFAIDAPLTRYLTGKFRKKLGIEDCKQEGGKK